MGVKQLVISLLALTMINLSCQLGNLAHCSLPHNSSQSAASRPKGLQRHTRRRSPTRPPARPPAALCIQAVTPQPRHRCRLIPTPPSAERASSTTAPARILKSGATRLSVKKETGPLPAGMQLTGCSGTRCHRNRKASEPACQL